MKDEQDNYKTLKNWLNDSLKIKKYVTTRIWIKKFKHLISLLEK